MTVVCLHVTEMGITDLESRLFENGTSQLALVERMIVELQNVV